MSRYLAIGLGLLALSPAGQDTDVKGARISVASRETRVLQITIENRRASPLVAWEIGLSEPGGSFARRTTASDFSGRVDQPWMEGHAIKPHEQRTIDVSLTDTPQIES